MKNIFRFLAPPLAPLLALLLFGISPAMAAQEAPRGDLDAIRSHLQQWQERFDRPADQDSFHSWWTSRRQGAFHVRGSKATPLETGLEGFWRSWFAMNPAADGASPDLARLTKKGGYADLLQGAFQETEVLEHLGNQGNFRVGFNPLVRQKGGFRFGIGIGGWSSSGNSGVGAGAGMTFGGKDGDGGEVDDSPFGPDSKAATHLLNMHMAPGSWNEEDLEAATLALTGWTTCDTSASRRKGELVLGSRVKFLEAAHDSQEKTFQGRILTSRGKAQGLELLADLAKEDHGRRQLAKALTEYFRPGEHEQLTFNIEQIMARDGWTWQQVFFVLIQE